MRTDAGIYPAVRLTPLMKWDSADFVIRCNGAYCGASVLRAAGHAAGWCYIAPPDRDDVDYYCPLCSALLAD